MLSSLAREGSDVHRLQWIETCLPDDGSAVRRHVSDHAVLDIEHPSGYFSVTLDVRRDGDEVEVEHAALVRTARLLMRGDVFVPSNEWPER